MILTQKHLELGGKAVISHFTFRPPLMAAADLDNTACFIFPINTQGNLYRADGKTEVHKDQGVLMKCGTYVNKWYSVGTHEVAEVVILRFHPEVMATIMENSALLKLDEPRKATKLNAVVELDALLQKYLEGLFFYFENRALATEELVALKIKELTMLLLNSKCPNPIVELLSTLFHRDNYQFKAIINANIFEDVSLEEMATIANMSPSTFKRKFKSEYQTTFTKYITEKRLQRASELLLDDSLSISAVAYDCGFNDPGYFAKLFKKRYQLSPTSYRKEN